MTFSGTSFRDLATPHQNDPAIDSDGQGQLSDVQIVPPDGQIVTDQDSSVQIDGSAF